MTSDPADIVGPHGRMTITVDPTPRLRSTGPKALGAVHCRWERGAATFLVFANTVLRIGSTEIVGDPAWVGPVHAVDVFAALFK